MPTLKKNYIVNKRNVLNEIRANSMNLTELRFFSIYLSKIHKDKPEETRVVRFPLDDFRTIMELSSRLNIKHMRSVTNSLLCKVVNVPDERGGYTGFQLFKECTVSRDDNDEWYVEIDAHDKALPLMFDFKNKYFSYPLHNILRLKSPNQHRMYELLKQYQAVGVRILSVNDLKEYLGIGKDEYPRFGDFKTYVLNACQQALTENTDIQFTYEPYGKRGKSGKIISLKFKIEKNENHANKLTLDEFIQQNEIEEEEELQYFRNDQISFLMGACKNEFSALEIQILADLIIKIIPYSNSYQYSVQNEQYDYLKRKYDELQYRAAKQTIRNRFGYLKKIIKTDFDLK